MEVKGKQQKKRDPKLSKEGPHTPTRNIRSPCADSHYEAYILQSKWTVGNLYASNLYLGQTHAKYVQHLDRQQRAWLHSKEWEQEKFEKKLEKLQALRRSSLPKQNEGRVTERRGTSSERSTIKKRKSTINDGTLTRTLSTQVDALQIVHEEIKAMKAYHHGYLHGNIPHATISSLPSYDWASELRQETRRKLAKSVSTLSTGIAREKNPNSWSRRKTTLSANPRLTGTSYDRVGSMKFVPKWVPLAFRMQNVRAGPLMK